MKFSSSSLVLATLAIGQATAASMSVKHNHAARHADMMRTQNEHREIAKRDTSILSPRDMNSILSLGLVALGVNPTSNTAGHAWIGADGQYTNEFFNEGTEDLVLAIWGPAGSWVNVIQPQITVSIPANTSKVISFPNGVSGAWAPIYSDTKLVNGQISETWGEFTFNAWGVVDVSREVNMNGKSMKIVGPTCTTDMNTCVFVCPAGQSVCTYGYILKNCDNGSQVGATYGTYAGAPSGGCGGMGASAHLKTYLN